MPILLEKKWVEGWLRRNPSDLCLVIDFINKKTGNRIFQYAPKHEDKDFFLGIFTELEEHEKLKKERKCACPEE